MNSKIYIGKNGIGKSEKLLDIKKEHGERCFYISFSGTKDAPDNSIINKNNNLLKELESFLKNLLTLTDELSKDEIKILWQDKENFSKFKENYEKLNDYIKDRNDEKNENKWEKLLQEDEDLNFLNKTSNLIKITNKIEDLKITINIENFLSIDTSKLKFSKDTSKLKSSKEKIYNHGTGKLVYFQIKMLEYLMKYIPKANYGKFYIIIDEPESFLHNHLKKKVARILANLSNKINIIIATHSPIFANFFYDSNTTRIYTKKKYNDNNWQEIKFKNNNNFLKRKELFEILFVDRIIICEGNNDYKLLNHILFKHWYKKSENEIYILVANGKNKIKEKINAISSIKLTNDERFFDDKKINVLFDWDEGQIGKRKKLWNAFENEINKTSLDQKDKDFIIEKMSEWNHKENNKDLEISLKKKDIDYHFFKNNLDDYFGINKNDEQFKNLDKFFENTKNSKKLEEFISTINNKFKI